MEGKKAAFGYSKPFCHDRLSLASSLWSNGAPTRCETLGAESAWHIQCKPNLLLRPGQAALCWGALAHKLSVTDSNGTKL